MEGFHSGMTKEQVLSWFAAKLNRKPTSVDIYSVAKDLYHVGEYQKAVRALEVYVTVPGRQISGLHLLGYAYYMCGDLEKAIEMFRSCVNEGFDSDWQLLIELQMELDNSHEQPQAIATSSS